MSYSPVCIVTGHTCVMWDFKLWFIEGLNRRIQKKKKKTITNIQTGLDFWIILMIRHARITGVKQCIQYWTDSCRPLVTEASREARRRFVERWRGFLTHTKNSKYDSLIEKLLWSFWCFRLSKRSPFDWLISLLENDFTIRHFRRQKWINKPLKGPDPTSSDSVPSLGLERGFCCNICSHSLSERSNWLQLNSDESLVESFYFSSCCSSSSSSCDGGSWLTVCWFTVWTHGRATADLHQLIQNSS